MSKPGKRLSLLRSDYHMAKWEKQWLGWKPKTWSEYKRWIHKRERMAVKDQLRSGDNDA